MPDTRQDAAALQTQTFLLTDIEGSTRLWQEYPGAMRTALSRHDALLTGAVVGAGGRVFKSTGDGTFGVFQTAKSALDAAVAAQRALIAEFPEDEPPALRVRMAIHTGDAESRDNDFFGTPLNHIARLCGAIHGGQIVVSEATERLLRESGVPADTRLLDLGEHRLRDLSARERIFQVLRPELPEQFPPIRSLDSLPNNLPHQLTSFVGRDDEMAAINRRLLGTPRQRLVTLTGAGGSGKTRLALQSGADVLPHFPDGVFFIDLAALADPSQTCHALAEALGVRESAGRSLPDEVAGHLADKKLLLLLDNCEHLVAACARLCNDLLRRCPGVSIVATSREPLGVPGEHVFPVAPLATPDRPGRADLLPPEGHATDAWLDRYPALRLFTERARAAAPDFRVGGRNVFAVAEICRRLDGIPLALELVAAWSPTLAPEQMEQHLSQIVDAPSGFRTTEERHRTLRATLDWSYDLLSEVERTLLRRLAIFSGGWTLEAARAVCSDAAIPEFQVVVALNGLVQKSLVVRRERTDADPRYRLLETIREYASRALAEAGEDEALVRRHQEFFLRASEEAEPHLRGAEQKQWLDRLEDESDNLRAAMSAPGGGEGPLRIATAVSWYWCVRGHFSEGRQRLDAAIAASGNAPESAIGRARSALGVLLLNQGRTDDAADQLSAALEIFDRTGDEARAAAMRGNLGIIASKRRDFDTARSLLTGALDYFRATGDDARVARVLSNLVAVLIEQEEFDEALVYLRESIVTSHSHGDQHGVAVRLHLLGEIALRQERFDEAGGLFAEELQRARELGDMANVIAALHSLGKTMFYRGSTERSLEILSAAASLRAKHGLETSSEAETTASEVMTRVSADAGAEQARAIWDRGGSLDLSTIMEQVNNPSIRVATWIG